MTTTTETHIVYMLNELHLITEATGAHIFVTGTANSSASNARLVPADVPMIPEHLVFDLIADHGSSTVMTPVYARAEIELGAVRTIMVRSGRNQLSLIVNEQQVSAPASTELLHRSWSVRHFVVGDAHIPVLSGTRLTASFTAQATVDGSGGCNQYGARYLILKRNPPGIAITPLHSTLRMCREEVMEQERRFFDGLRSATDFECNDEALTLSWDGNFAIVFDLAKRSTP